MIRVAEARSIVLDNVIPLGSEVVGLDECLFRVLAQPVTARRHVPPRDNSAMDGFALTAAATGAATEQNPAALPIVRTIRAGDRAGDPVGEEQVVRIMTGAPVPEGIDTVVPVEQTRVEAETLYLTVPLKAGANIRRAGEDIREGEEMFLARRPLRPADLGLVASQGIAQLRVFRRPEVAILATGDEVVSLGEVPHEAQIYSSNTHALTALVRECGAVPRQLGIAKDDPDHLAVMIEEGLQSDVLVTTGGVSMGDYDYLKDVFREVGVEVLFWKVAQKPGKPMTFGVRRGKPVFALPGNPVSATLSFELYVRPALRKMMGHTRLFRPTVRAVLEQDVKKKPGRRNFIRGVVERKEDGILYAHTTGKQGSGILRSMSAANGIIILPEDAEGAKAGERVEVYLIDSEEALSSDSN
ncbi:MAG: molybdopterin molybdotransferase MoeA [bacterium]|nr:molybdopterin molybdotransferase MoeA [bacterium]MDT8396761.1 molybdopterin molybdotransferase MoeA [bacterium]